MNVTFRLPSEELEKKFAKEATAAGLDGLKGHRSVGGLRASIYNAFPEAGVDALVQFMQEFERRTGELQPNCRDRVRRRLQKSYKRRPRSPATLRSSEIEEPSCSADSSTSVRVFVFDRQLGDRRVHGAVPCRRRGRVLVHDWTNFSSALVLHWLAVGFGISLGYHRLHTHRGYKTSKAFEYFLAVCGTLTLEGGPIFWVATHRVHHQHSDQDGDPHTPRDGGFWAHMGWILFGDTHHNNTALMAKYAPDLAGDPFYRWLNTYHYVPLTMLGLRAARRRRLADGALGHLPARRRSACTRRGW